MSILQKLRLRNASAGYATDFVSLLRRILPVCRARGIKIVANAGGVNPEACREATIEVVRSLGLHGLRIGIVRGDDLLDRLQGFIAAGEPFDNLETGEHLGAVLPRILSANAYIGARPIATALDQGADIVITGRAADPSLTVGPLLHEFGWHDDDIDKIAAGTVAGHIIECGAQCTGGNHTNWRDVPDLAGVGYPIVEFHRRRRVHGNEAPWDRWKGRHLDHYGTIGIRAWGSTELYQSRRYSRLHLCPTPPRWIRSCVGQQHLWSSGNRYLQGIHCIPRRLQGGRTAHGCWSGCCRKGGSMRLYPLRAPSYRWRSARSERLLDRKTRHQCVPRGDRRRTE